MESCRGLAAGILVAILAGCGGGGSNSSYTVGGTVSGLGGSGLVLLATGGDSLAISSSGSFQFPTAVANGSSFSVTVQTQPSAPSQTCTVSPTSGTISGANVTNIVVACTTSSYKIGGTIIGLTGTGLVLSDNGGDLLTVSAAGTVTFASPVLSGHAYSVTVQSQPAFSASGLSESCTVMSGTGTVAAADVTTIAVDCSDAPITAGGSMLATSTGQSINLFRVSSAWGTAGVGPTPLQSIATPNITGIAVDPPGTIYYTANSGVSGSDSNFYVCPAPEPGRAYSCSAGLNTVALAGGKLLTFDPTSGYLLAAQITSAGTTIVQFPASPGPTSTSEVVVYTSNGTPSSVNAQVIWRGNQPQIFVTEIPSGSTFGTGVKAYACGLPCNPGTQLDVTQTLINAVATPSMLSGALSTDSGSLVVGLANAYGASEAPTSLPVALSCAPDLELATEPNTVDTFSCNESNQADPDASAVSSFPLLAGSLNPFIGTTGLAVDSVGQLYAAAALTDYGQTLAPSLLDGYSFFGFVTTPHPFACSTKPATCPVDLLPSLPASSNGAIAPFLLAVSGNCQPQPGSIGNYCGTFTVTWTSQAGATPAVTVNGLIWFSTLLTTNSTVGPGGPGTQFLSACAFTILGKPGPLTSYCGGSTTASGAVLIDAAAFRFSFSGQISGNMVSGTVTSNGYLNTTGVGSGTFTASAISQ